jgi:hypothetical protein
MRILGKPLITQVYHRLPRTLIDAFISRRHAQRGTGWGHNATTVAKPAVVGTVVGFYRSISMAYPPPQRHNGKNPRTHVHAHAPVIVRVSMTLCRCGVVPSLYLFDLKEKKKERGHNGSHNAWQIGRCGIAKSLKTLNKGYF